MLKRGAIGLVSWCWRHAALVVALAALLTTALGYYAAGHLGIDTDENKMLSPDLAFRRAERAMDRAFPQNADQLVVVIDAPTSGQAEQAVTTLAARLADRHDLFHDVRRPPEEVFFRRYGLLFLSPDELTALSDQLTQAQPLLGTVARDPSLRGLLSTLDLALEGVARGMTPLDQLGQLLDPLDRAAGAIAAGRPATAEAWAAMAGEAGAHDAPRRFLLTQPILRYGELEPGHAAAEAVRQAASAAGLTPEHGIRVRLTGSVALEDANFASVTQGVEISAPLSAVAVLILLFLAVRSARVVAAILLSLVVGLVATAAFATAAVGSLNPISVAFAVMFVGIAVDFAIQFTVRYRDTLHTLGEPWPAALACAADMATPLSLAATATAIGFLSFVPTAYSGVSQLGLIAGMGMIIALVVDFTVLPALLALLHPPAEKDPVGLRLAVIDRWQARNWRTIAGVSFIVAAAGAVLLPFLPLDFNPLHLQNPRDEAVSTFLELARDRDSGAYAVDALAPDGAAARALADRLGALPEVARTMTLDTFVPERQDEKLAILTDLAGLLGPSLQPAQTLAAPSPAETRAALLVTAAKLREIGTRGPALALADHLRQVAEAGPAAMQSLERALVPGLAAQLGTFRQMLAVAPVTRATLPAELVRDWVAPDGQQRVQAQPRGNMEDETQLFHFADVVRAVAPDAAGLPIAVQQSGQVVVGAFTDAGLTALAAIAVLLGVLLRRLLDALLVVMPLVVGALFTSIGVVAGGLAINFANIIALPLLLGIGVAFNIYFVVNWRNGVTNHLQTATARAVLFSALTTGSAFGSLAVSPHLGTASMGLLLFLSLGLSVLTTFLVLPAWFHALGHARR